MLDGGRQLRRIREKLGLSMRDVEAASRALAAQRSNSRLVILPPRLSAIERRRAVPTIYRLYTLSRIYRRDIRELLALYGLK